MRLKFGEDVVVDAKMQKAWQRAGRAWVCFFCGRDFEVGEVIRWVYTNSSDLPRAINGNPHIHVHDCLEHDSPPETRIVAGVGSELFERMAKHAARAELALSKYAWFLKRVRDTAVADAERSAAEYERKYG